MAADTQSMPFIKHLASSDRKIRTSALDTLRTFLSASASAARLTRTDNLKLWKGLYYSLWMCDRPVPQQNLCADLAGLLATISSSAGKADRDGPQGVAVGDSVETQVVVAWLSAFWETLAREWTSIDVLRLEKFLLLVRRVLGASLAWAVASPGVGSGKSAVASKKNKKAAAAAASSKKRKGVKAVDLEDEHDEQQKDTAATAPSSTLSGRQTALIQLLREWPLDGTGDLGRVPVGLRLHVMDIWVDEAEKAGVFVAASAASTSEEEEEESSKGEVSASAAAPPASAFLEALRDLVEAQSGSPSKPVRARAKESLADERLPWNEARATSDDGQGEDEDMGGGEDKEEKDGWGGFDD
ncbi:Nucleolar protein,Nop52 [Microdochium nivale]|nr:Nucleolar protein,Nop52 [Microdochium nivale]